MLRDWAWNFKNFDNILDHFDRYPLQSCKHADFIFFKEIILKIRCGEHLTVKGLQDIVNIKANLNKGLSPLLKEAFPNFLQVPRSTVINPIIPNPNWLAGFAEGESCFTISLNKNRATKTGYIVSLKFEISQDLRDEKLLQNIVNYIGCGKVYRLTTGSFNRGNILVSKISDILNKIIPFFQDFPLLGVKSKAFKNWSAVAELMQKKEHLSEEGLEKIKIIKKNLNKTTFKPSRSETR